MTVGDVRLERCRSPCVAAERGTSRIWCEVHDMELGTQLCLRLEVRCLYLGGNRCTLTLAFPNPEQACEVKDGFSEFPFLRTFMLLNRVRKLETLENPCRWSCESSTMRGWRSNPGLAIKPTTFWGGSADRYKTVSPDWKSCADYLFTSSQNNLGRTQRLVSSQSEKMKEDTVKTIFPSWLIAGRITWFCLGRKQWLGLFWTSCLSLKNFHRQNHNSLYSLRDLKKNPF